MPSERCACVSAPARMPQRCHQCPQRAMHFLRTARTHARGQIHHAPTRRVHRCVRSRAQRGRRGRGRVRTIDARRRTSRIAAEKLHLVQKHHGAALLEHRVRGAEARQPSADDDHLRLHSADERRPRRAWWVWRGSASCRVSTAGMLGQCCSRPHGPRARRELLKPPSARAPDAEGSANAAPAQLRSCRARPQDARRGRGGACAWRRGG
jgi:hypothetical protein